MQSQEQSSHFSSAHWAMAAQTLIAGTSFSFARAASVEFHPLVLTLLRVTGSAAIFSVLFLSQGGFKGKFPTRYEWRNLFALSFVGISLGQFLFLFGLKFTTPSSSAVLYSMTPLWVLLIGVGFSKTESLSIRKIIAIGVAVSGGLIVLIGGGKSLSLEKEMLIGNLLSLGAVWCWASYLAFGKKVLANYAPIQGTALMMMLGAAMFLPIGILPAWSFEWSSVSLTAWVGAGWVTMLGSVVAYGLISFALSKLTPSQISVFMNAQPAIATAVSMLFFGEPFSWSLVIGGLLAVSGIMMLQRA